MCGKYYGVCVWPQLDLKGRAKNDPELKCISAARLTQEHSDAIFVDDFTFHIALCRLSLLQGPFALLYSKFLWK
jgi:hypothetical protein